MIPTYNESPEMVARCVESVKGLEYAKDRIKFYLIDDSSDPAIKYANQKMCKKNGLTCINRELRSNFKAGAFNNALKHSKEEFVAIFDADEHLTNKRFLLDLLPYFQDKNVSFVQTEKRARKGTLFSESVDVFDGIFFRFIQPARALNGTAIFAGSCGVIRRSALDAVGGFPEFITEDTFFSFESDMHNFKSIFVPKIYALGKPILSFSKLMSQQWRYNYGDTQFLLYFLRQRKLDKNRVQATRSALSKIDYMAHGFGLNYISSILILFTLVSMLIVLSVAPFAYLSIKQAFTPPYTALNLELLGISAFLLTVLVPVALSKAYFNSARKGLMIFILNFALAFARLKGAAAALLSKKPVWITGNVGKEKRLFAAARNSGIELTFSIVLFSTSFVAALVYNISGALWLLWYGILYCSAFVFYYKYG